MYKFLFFIIFISLGFAFTSFNTEGKNAITEEVYLKDRVVVSPNPAKSYTKVISESNTVKISKVEVYSMANTKVLEVNSAVPAKSIQINVYKLNKGKYFVKAYLSDNSEKYASLIKL